MSRYEEIVSCKNKLHHELRDIYPCYTGSSVCTAIALAVACDIDYDLAIYAIYDTLGKRPGSFGWDPFIDEVIPALGYKATRVPLWAYRARTVGRLEKDGELGEGSFIIACSGYRHAVGMVNGVVEDYTKGRRHRIQRVYRITKEI
jgi:hypothetical protein